MKLRLISCEVLYREMCDAVARSPHLVDAEFLPKGWHDLGGKRMSTLVQERIDAVPRGAYDAIVLGYGLCGNGLDGIEARHTMLVLPRAHDCIALLMGGRQRYQKFFEEHPGTFYRSTGWLERGKGLRQLTHATADLDATLEELVAKYGLENGRYLYEELTRYRQNYQRLVYIETGLESDRRFEEEARWEAAENGWEFQKIRGSLELFRRLVNGEWGGGEFLLVQPGERIRATYDDRVVSVETVREIVG
ncbi:MAG: DUF1638 domain-containing protein [Bryobacteraceae bacterium]